MFDILLLNGTRFACKPDTSILESASAKGIALEHSCKTGQCGVCASRVISGTTEVLKAELSLTTEQQAQGLILTCCRTAASEVELDAEDLPELQGISVKTCPARIDSLEKVSSEIVKVLLRSPPNNTFQFLPGQYISVIGPNGLRRSYSVANTPRADGKIELHIKKVEDGALSRYWFEQAKVNDLLRFEGPLGTFFARKPLPKKLLLLATGTGIAPIKAILEGLMNSTNETAQPEVHVYWGNRHQEDIYLDLQQLAGPQINTHLVLSQPNNSWAGRKGYVQNAVLADHASFDNCAVYACGSINMIESAKAALIQSGLPSYKFHSDAFVSSNK